MAESADVQDRIETVTSRIACVTFVSSGDLLGMRTVTATFDDGSERVLFAFYSDELSFTEDEFVGLTETDARRLHHERDVAWLRS